MVDFFSGFKLGDIGQTGVNMKPILKEKDRIKLLIKTVFEAPSNVDGWRTIDNLQPVGSQCYNGLKKI